MDLDSAIRAHGEWKLKLRMAIQKKEQLDARAISCDNACPLGKWLHGEAKTKYGNLKSYSTCVDKHAAFHLEAGKVASAINTGKYSEAEAMLAGGTAYAVASSSVGTAVISLRQESGL